jgi:hypothetical protein
MSMIVFFVFFIIFHIWAKPINNSDNKTMLINSDPYHTLSYMHFWKDWYKDDEAGDRTQHR